MAMAEGRLARLQRLLSQNGVWSMILQQPPRWQTPSRVREVKLEEQNLALIRMSARKPDQKMSQQAK